MAAAVDTGNFFLEKNATVANSVTTTGSMTVASSDNFLGVFMFAFANVTSFNFTSVSWNGNSLTYGGTRVQNNGQATDGEFWYLTNPPAGTGTMTAAINGAQSLGGATFFVGIPMSGVNVLGTFLGTIATFNTVTNPCYPLGVTASGAGLIDLYLGWTDGNVTTATATGSNQVSIGGSGGGNASYILGSNSGAFTWSSTGGSNSNALAMAVPIFGFGVPPFGGGVCVTA